MDWNAIKQWLEGGSGIYNIWPWWVGLLFCIAIVSVVVLLIMGVVYAMTSDYKQKKEDKRNMDELIQRGYKKDVIEDFINIYNAELKYIIKYKTIENELKNFSTGKVVSLPGKTKQDDGSSAAAGLAAGMIIGSSMHR
jgi:hypothetical protein